MTLREMFIEKSGLDFPARCGVEMMLRTASDRTGHFAMIPGHVFDEIESELREAECKRNCNDETALAMIANAERHGRFLQKQIDIRDGEIAALRAKAAKADAAIDYARKVDDQGYLYGYEAQKLAEAIAACDAESNRTGIPERSMPDDGEPGEDEPMTTSNCRLIFGGRGFSLCQDGDGLRLHIDNPPSSVVWNRQVVEELALFLVERIRDLSFVHPESSFLADALSEIDRHTPPAVAPDSTLDELSARIDDHIGNLDDVLTDHEQQLHDVTESTAMLHDRLSELEGEVLAPVSELYRQDTPSHAERLTALEAPGRNRDDNQLG
ncbi:MAG: hypothetical protein ACR2OE_04080 [Thermomicrobiales bacterium]